MLRLAKTLIAGTALLTLAALPVSAAESNSSGGQSGYHEDAEAIIINGQVNLSTIWSQLNTTMEDVHGDAAAQVSAAGNTAEIITFANTSVDNDQYTQSVIGAELTGNVNGVGGDVSLSSSTLCNGVSVSTDPRVTSVKNRQVCGVGDPSARVDAQVSNVAGNVGIQAASVGNQLETDTNATHMPITSSQLNQADVLSTVNARISHVGGSVGVSATAVGNTAQIIHY